MGQHEWDAERELLKGKLKASRRNHHLTCIELKGVKLNLHKQTALAMSLDTHLQAAYWWRGEANRYKLEADRVSAILEKVMKGEKI